MANSSPSKQRSLCETQSVDDLVTLVFNQLSLTRALVKGFKKDYDREVPAATPVRKECVERMVLALDGLEELNKKLACPL